MEEEGAEAPAEEVAQGEGEPQTDEATPPENQEEQEGEAAAAAGEADAEASEAAEAEPAPAEGEAGEGGGAAEEEDSKADAAAAAAAAVEEEVAPAAETSVEGDAEADGPTPQQPSAEGEAGEEGMGAPPPVEEGPGVSTEVAGDGGNNNGNNNSSSSVPGPETSITVSAVEGTVSIDFVILPEGYGQTKLIDLGKTIAQIRADLEGELSIPEGSLFLMNMSGAAEVKEVLPSEQRLCDFGLKADDKIGIELRINYYQEQPADDYIMPDTLELRVTDAQGREKVVVVHVQRPVVEKSYLGGFRNRQSGVSYHHATTQTAPPPKKETQAIRFHREAQTYQYRTRSTQCKKDNGTQMPKVGLYIDSVNDYEITPRRPYFSSADKTALMLEKCVIIQCHARGMVARKRAGQLRKARISREELAAKEEERRQLEADLRHKREVERRMQPKTLEDFAVLYRELEAWRLNEANRIAKAGFDEAARRAAQRELLHKETKLLQTIDQLKIHAKTHNRDSKIKKKLESMANPKVWPQNDGETTTVHTPYTTRAKELMDLYSGLRLPLLTVDERLDVLLHVKWTVKEFDCNLTREIVDLIDREADMLNRGRPEKSFAGLRKRLANLFLQFLEAPEFNPEAMKFQKVSRQLYDQSSTHPLSTVPIRALGQV
mmetsp:Transcript_91487/g.191239  ORF Transcript_91487/g.191239 Transcript_91487/m.191239 type:complete len:660 (-) Transcript_91487:228-2207(-)